MDLVSVTVDEPMPGECVGLVFADDEGGDPAQVIGRVLQRHGELVGMLPGSTGEVAWNPGTPLEKSYPTSWD